MPPGAAMTLVLALAVTLTGTLDAAAAQRRSSNSRYGRPAETAPRQYTGGALLYGIPYREFGDQVGKGYGFDAVGSNAANASGVTRIRTDVTLLYNGNLDVAVPPENLAASDQMTLGTAANLFHFLLGPEFAVPTGGFRPYMFGVAGFGTAYVRQSLSGRVNGGVDSYQLDSSQRTSMFTWGFGAGVRLRTSPTSLLDLGAEYRNAQGARMVTPSRVTTSGGAVGYSQRSVDAEQIIIRVGFARAK